MFFKKPHSCRILVSFFSHLHLEINDPPPPKLFSVVKSHSITGSFPFACYKFFAFNLRCILLWSHMNPSCKRTEKESKMHVYMGQTLLQIINITWMTKLFFYKISKFKNLGTTQLFEATNLYVLSIKWYWRIFANFICYNNEHKHVHICVYAYVLVSDSF